MIMELRISHYIDRLLKRACYTYDPSVKAWSGWIKGFPGVYAQGRNVEEVRAELIATLEDYLLLNLEEGNTIPGFSISPRSYAKTS